MQWAPSTTWVVNVDALHYRYSENGVMYPLAAEFNVMTECGHMGVVVTWASWSHGRRGHMGVVVTWASWSHGRRGHTGVVVTRASWSHGCRGHMGVVVTWVSWSHGRRGHMGVVVLCLAASCVWCEVE
ncbi:hypothetical protein NHX12_021361 [Muraenolepis orangiensis]|uniref:Uncharacterized protein n=1 Tax=Muraenolepis orangiensis TaxID=630683 RepID=A0A9Q0ETJ2_9TELE|nr:hypothetical protein NHX12_021361 [Muraenolepis orangiensis]